METIRSADGTPIAVEREGSGPALVVVTGALCDRRAVAPLGRALAGACTVHRYDRRGRGDSGDDAGPPPYSPDREVDDLAAVVAAAGGSALVYGHSSGAALALLAGSRRLPITGLVAYEPPYDVEPDPEAGEFRRTIEGMVAAGRPADAATTFLTAAGMSAAELRDDPWFTAAVVVAHTLPYDLAVVGESGLPCAELARISVPTLLLTGSESPPWLGETAEAVAAAVPGARLTVLPGQHHNPAPDVLARVITDFRTPATH
jgi:pimeloyl-ACP methyl ester carboxylesterase